jgi:DNA-binding NtrC family response regulator
MAFVLCTGTDPEVMKTRQKTLERAGHRVLSAVNEHDLMAACKEHKFDVVIIGQTLVPEMKQHVVDLIRKHCSETKLLELYLTSENRTVEDADAWLEVNDNIAPNIAEHVSDLAQAA